MAHLQISSAAEQRILNLDGVRGIGHGGPNTVVINVESQGAVQRVREEIGSTVEGFAVEIEVTGGFQPVQDLDPSLASRLLAIEGVSSVGRSGNTIVIGVVSESAAQRVRQRFGGQLGNLDVSVTVTGSLQARQSDIKPVTIQPLSRTERKRPVPMGVSVAHEAVTAGTSGYPLTDGSSLVLASNNHVMANSNQAQSGDAVLQPGPADGGSKPDDVIGTLQDFVGLSDGVTVDLAWTSPSVEVTERAVNLGQSTAEVVDPEPGDTLIKSGRSSAISKGTVRQVGASIQVNYGGEIGTVTLRNQVLTDPMLIPGDSGSPGFVREGGQLRPAGLGFAGSSKFSAFNLASRVEEASGLSIISPQQAGGEPEAPEVPLETAGVAAGGIIAGALGGAVLRDALEGGDLL